MIIKNIMIFILLLTIIPIINNCVIIEVVVTSDEPLEWNIIYGGTNFDQVFSSIQTTDGGYALFGTTNSFGAGKSDCWLVKTDTNGVVQWNQTYGGEGMDDGNSVIQTLDGGYIFLGTTESFGIGYSNCWLVKTYANGIIHRNQTYGKKFTSTFGNSILNTNENEYIIAGTQHSGVAINLWLIKISSNGTIIWDRNFTSKNQLRNINSMIQTADGGFLIVGDIFSDQYRSDILLIKTDMKGVMQWNKTIGYDSIDDEAYSIIQTTDGGFALTGETDVIGYRSVMWLIKTDSTGNILWNQTYKGINDDRGAVLVQKTDGGFIIAGNTNSYGHGGFDVWLVETNAEGKKIRDQTFGGKENDYINAIFQKIDGGFIIVGNREYGCSDIDIWLFSTKPQWWINRPSGIPGFNLLSAIFGIIVLVYIFCRKRK